ncbi:MAG: hypothetical protein WBC68_13015 [Albidovulum sp.]
MGLHTIGAGLSLLIALGLLAVLWGRMINHDTAWYLLATREWLDGARPYIDFSEVNPPLNYYYTVPPILLADLFGITDTNAQYLVVCALIFVSLCWSWSLLSEISRLPPPRRMCFLIGLGLALIIPALGDIGQREHLLVVFITPWLLGEIADGPKCSRRGVVARAVFAALGICLKPHFILFPIVVNCGHILRTRSLRPVLALSNITMFSVGLIYLIAVYGIHPEYFSDVIPLTRQVYGSIGGSGDAILFRLAVTLLPFALAGATMLVSKAAPTGTRVFVSAAVAGMLSYLLQWTGFGYHIIPFNAFGIMAGIWIILHADRITPMVVGCLVAVSVVLWSSVQSGFYGVPAVEDLIEAMSSRQPPDRVLVVSTFVHAGPPVALAFGAKWASRYPGNWMVPGAVNGLRNADCAADPAHCARLTDIANRSRAENLTDIAKYQPEILVIDRRSGYIEDPNFSWYDFLGQDPRWNTILSKYHLSKTTQRFDIWSR